MGWGKVQGAAGEEKGKGEGESQAGFMASLEPNMGLSIS